jgi:iron complex transport system ATP-binding protein
MSATRETGGASQTAGVILAVDNVSLAVPGRTLCSSLSLTVAAGERWVVVGPNGVGKTTLLAALAGLRLPAAGSIRLDGRALREWTPRERALRMGLLPQDTVDAFPDTALEIALAGRHPHVPRWRAESKDDMALAEAALDAVECKGLARRNVQTLSGGERRRVALAQLIAQDPAIMLLDEPTNHLDVAHEVRMLDLLAARVARGRRAIVMSIHDLTLAARHATHALLFGFDGVAAGPVNEMLTERRLSALYGQPLARVDFEDGVAFLPRATRSQTLPAATARVSK